jgi:hypothetical protein
VGAVAPTPMVLLPALRALLPTRAEVAGRASGRVVVWSEWVVAFALGLGRRLPLGRYGTHYRLPLGPVDGSDVSHLDWFV